MLVHVFSLCVFHIMKRLTECVTCYDDDDDNDDNNNKNDNDNGGDR